MAYDALDIVKHRNDFYRDGYRKLALAILICLLVIAGLVGTIVVMVTNRPTPVYFATTDAGRIIPLVPLNRPNLSDQALLQWSSEAVLSIYSYNFVNYRDAFQNNKKYFTKGGWDGFSAAMQASNNLQAVQDKKLVVSAVLTGAPVVLNEGILAGRYTWKVQMPITVTYQGMGTADSQNFIVTLTIKRVSTLDDIYGVGISEFIATQS